MHDVITDKISIHFIEAQKCKELSVKNKNRLVRWMKYLTYSSPEDVVEIAREDEVFAHVLEAEKMFVRNREEMLKYEAQERYEMDMATIKAEGKLEALLATAKEMLAGGLNVEQVKKFTKLTDKELANLL